MSALDPLPCGHGDMHKIRSVSSDEIVCQWCNITARPAPKARPEYPPNVQRFINKWQPDEEPRRRAFWKEFRKAANAYAKYDADRGT